MIVYPVERPVYGIPMRRGQKRKWKDRGGKEVRIEEHEWRFHGQPRFSLAYPTTHPCRFGYVVQSNRLSQDPCMLASRFITVRRSAECAWERLRVAETNDMKRQYLRFHSDLYSSLFFGCCSSILPVPRTNKVIVKPFIPSEATAFKIAEPKDITSSESTVEESTPMMLATSERRYVSKHTSPNITHSTYLCFSAPRVASVGCRDHSLSTVLFSVANSHQHSSHYLLRWWLLRPLYHGRLLNAGGIVQTTTIVINSHTSLSPSCHGLAPLPHSPSLWALLLQDCWLIKWAQRYPYAPKETGSLRC